MNFKLFNKIIITSALVAMIPAGIIASSNARPKMANIEFSPINGSLDLKMDIVLDSVKLKANQQLLVTPVIEDGKGASEAFPTILVNGRNMHYAYERGSLNPKLFLNYDISKELRRENGKKQSVAYSASTPLKSWMYGTDARIRLSYDTCGCGKYAGSDAMPPIPLDLNPYKKMRPAYLTPSVTELPVQIHEGKARVQFEVDKTVLHASPYICRNGQRIDNREQLKVITDSIEYALSDPNVEIARVDITGYASPESPYDHNDYLATNRSKALSEWIGDRYKLSRDVTNYSAVPENWAEFREQVLASKELTDKQRSDLLALIDRPCYGPSDYDQKEKELKTDPKFAKLYKTTILPKWFPILRTTKFAISTRLKPMNDEKLAEIIKTHPEQMSLNQMFRVARLYPEDSPEFQQTIATALRFYGDNEEANTNAAADAVKRGDYEAAEGFVAKSGSNPQAENIRGILAAKRGDFEAARKHFDNASPLPEARENRALLK